ncbi:S-layer homology domain-containing protein [Paenibacillus sp. KN14-4R]|uniref:S-layer homology domain-containing protein n=1 Tax=Paenibacillus sp. KN14-4R TaxID=3445773 RepID=UPI003FA17A69
MKLFKRNLHKPLKTLVLSSLILTAAPLYALPAQAAITSTQPSTTAQLTLANEYKQYVQDQYGLTLSEAATRGEFVNAVSRILQLELQDKANPFTDIQKDSPYYKAANALYQHGILTRTTLEATESLTQLDATFIALKASNLKELAYTYPEVKVRAALKKLHIDYDQTNLFTKQAAQEVAAAVDTGLIPSDLYDTFNPEAQASSDFTAVLLGKILTFNGNYKHDIGNVFDKDIFKHVYEAYKTEDLISAPELRTIFDTALKQNLVTGYNLKDARYNANFNPKLSLTYGHSDITHAIQLVGLLRSENINAKVQLEPKTSAFIYLKEWGEPTQSDDYQVVQIENGNYIAYAKEYDIAFEFDTVEQKDKFQNVIASYAKKNEENQKGLIAASWWQPLYYSLTKQQDYQVIANNKISKGHYYAQSFSQEKQAAAVTAGLKKISPKSQVDSYTFWVDEPFYRYLSGEYK